jgi:hypothetical protein
MQQRRVPAPILARRTVEGDFGIRWDEDKASTRASPIIVTSTQSLRRDLLPAR